NSQIDFAIRPDWHASVIVIRRSKRLSVQQSLARSGTAYHLSQQDRIVYKNIVPNRDRLTLGVSAPLILGLLGTAACIVSPGPSCVSAVELNVPAQYLTIQGAIDFASPGDTIRVSPGNYVEAIDFKGKNLTLLSTDGPSVTSI